MAERLNCGFWKTWKSKRVSGIGQWRPSAFFYPNASLCDRKEVGLRSASLCGYKKVRASSKQVPSSLPFSYPGLGFEAL